MLLIVDDRPENLFAMSSALAGLDVEILTAESGEHALSLMLRHSFAVVLLDAQMPGMDGIETAECMRAYHGTCTTPIIFVTAIDKEERHVFRGYEAGAVDYLFKPVDPVILRSKVQVFLDLFVQQQDLARALAQVERANEELDRLAYALRGLVGTAGRAARPDESARDIPEGQPLLDAEEMARRLRHFLQQRAVRVWQGVAPEERPEQTTDHAGHERNPFTTQVRFFDEVYELEGVRAPVLEVLIASMEEVVLLGRHVGEVHATLRREIEERRRAERASQVASEAKSRFLSNISHELRTPLNAIIGLSDLLLDTASDDMEARTVEDIRLINESGNFLLELIDRLMERSCIELGEMTVDLEVVDVFDLARNVSASLAPVAWKGQNSLDFECAEDIGLLRTDRVKLRQILHNLITNACKFTHGGEIRLGVSRGQLAGAECVVFQVSDTGIGIDPARQDEIFDDFKQLDTSSTRNHSGVGLGLSICKHYCELMGGTISVESTPGQGSVFTVRVPVDSSRQRLEDTLQ